MKNDTGSMSTEKVVNQNYIVCALLIRDGCADTCNTWRMCNTISAASVHLLRTYRNLLKTTKKTKEKSKTKQNKILYKATTLSVSNEFWYTEQTKLLNEEYWLYNKVLCTHVLLKATQDSLYLPRMNEIWKKWIYIMHFKNCIDNSAYSKWVIYSLNNKHTLCHQWRQWCS